MKAELRLAPHSQADGSMIEVWYGGRFIAAVYGADGPGVRIVSKSPFRLAVAEGTPNVVEVETCL